MDMRTHGNFGNESQPGSLLSSFLVTLRLVRVASSWSRVSHHSFRSALAYGYVRSLPLFNVRNAKSLQRVSEWEEKLPHLSDSVLETMALMSGSAIGR
jgi:hypothetical protein